MFKVECGSCGGTGLYKGFAEPEGYAVICRNCGGKGYTEATHVSSEAKIFERRKRKNGIRYVMTDGGAWFVRGAASQTPHITIDEFNERY
jgi:DnaJ-class molecular chaperone